MILPRAGWLSILLLSSGLFADCDFRPVFTVPFRITALDLAMDGTDLWVATSYGVDLYDRAADPPSLIGRIALPGTTARVEQAGPYAYVASGSSLLVLDRAGLRVAGSVDFALINDLLFAAPYLYAATATGVLQVDLLIPERPQLATRLHTTSGSALSLARSGTFLYAADGDGTVEVYTLQVPSFPQKIGTIGSLVRSIAVQAAGPRLFVSDGLQTEVFAGSGAQMTRIDSFLTSTLALHDFGGNVVFTAGLDRRLRARDLASSTVLFDAALPVSAGNVNRVQAMTGTAERLYLAAGDLGLLTFDLTGFRPPFPLRAYPTGGVRSVIESGSSVFAALDSGGIRRFVRDSRGLLIPGDWWDRERVSMVQDATTAALLSSRGNSLTLWDLTSSPPPARSTAGFSSPVRAAVLSDQAAYAVLENRSLWRADFSQQTAAVSPVTTTGANPWFIARDGTAIALADLEENGTTTIRYFGTGDLTASPQVISIEGAATSGIAVSREGFAAGATFRGVILANLGSGTTTVLPGTNTTPTRDLHISGDDLYILTPDKLQVWSLSSRELRAPYELPWEGLSLHHSEDEVTIAGAEGLITVVPRSERRQPGPIGRVEDNAYFRELGSGGPYLYLHDGRNIDVYATGSVLPVFVRRIPSNSNIIGITATEERLFVLSSFGKVTGYTPAGALAGEFDASAGDQAQPLAIRALAGALYVSTSRGCPLSCEKRTILLDPRALVPTVSFQGALMDGVVEDNVAYTLFDSPQEIRVLNVADPFRPTVPSTRPSDGDPVSIASFPSRKVVYTLGERLYAYDAASLTLLGSQLEPYVTDPTARLGYADQTLRVLSSDCAIIAGRAFNPQLHLLAAPAAWQQIATPQVPSPVRSIAASGGVIFLLTDHSLEVWSSRPLPRQRPARR